MYGGQNTEATFGKICEIVISRVVKYQDEEDTKNSAAKKLMESIKKNHPDYFKKITTGENILPKLNFEQALGYVFKIVTESLQSEVQIQDFGDWFEELATEQDGKKVIQLDP